MKPDQKKQLGYGHLSIWDDSNDKEDDEDTNEECIKGDNHLSSGTSEEDDDDNDDSSKLAADSEFIMDGVGFLHVKGKKEKKSCGMCVQFKLYLDSCATNHLMFAMEFLKNATPQE